MGQIVKQRAAVAVPVYLRHNNIINFLCVQGSSSNSQLLVVVDSRQGKTPPPVHQVHKRHRATAEQKHQHHHIISPPRCRRTQTMEMAVYFSDPFHRRTVALRIPQLTLIYSQPIHGVLLVIIVPPTLLQDRPHPTTSTTAWRWYANRLIIPPSPMDHHRSFLLLSQMTRVVQHHHLQ
jgi:hypothetical protein